MSSSSVAAATSRSPSPATPDSASDGVDLVAIDDAGLPSWYQSSIPSQSLSDKPWESDMGYLYDEKGFNQPSMLPFDDLIEQKVFDDLNPSACNGALTYPSPPSASSSSESPQAQSPAPPQSHVQAFPSQAPVSVTKPIPPPAPIPRKQDPAAASQTVVYPPKESCYNLPIMVPSIPEGGTKSRVETQVRVTVDLAHASSSSADPFRYDRVGTWKWLKLPPGTATKRRTRKEGKIDPAPEDILHLTCNVTCASPPHNPVLSCSSCQAREAKRVARKLAARVRPARSDSDSPGDGQPVKPKHEDTTSIVQFNCAEVLNFSTGSVVLPLRITCYCRHHREKTGFNVHFSMIDHSGRVIGTGTSRPIMITDDHKSTTGSTKQGNGAIAGAQPAGMDVDWPQASQEPEQVASRAPSKRNSKDDGAPAKRRTKPYDISSRRGSTKTSRETSVTSFPSPGPSSPLTRSPSPSNAAASLTQINEMLMTHSVLNGISGQQEARQQQPLVAAAESVPEVTLSADNTPPMYDETPPDFDFDVVPQVPQSPEMMSSSLGMAMPLMHPPPAQPVNPVSLPFTFFNPGTPPRLPLLPAPKIHRLIPNTGPTVGGIEVTVLGANFHPSVPLNCVFGDVVASSTQRWSDNTLLCILPPRATPGIVAVWFEGIEKESDGSPPSLFNYTDETDRALMELALQVVGLKMTGKLEEAKSVAMRIVGNGQGSESQGNSTDTLMGSQLSSSPTLSARDMRPLLMLRAGENEDFESLIIDFLSILDTPVDDVAPASRSTAHAISHQTASGQTLLHLACFLGFGSLVKFLLAREIDMDARDRNGYTALHFAALVRSQECAQLLVGAGADEEIVNALGKTPAELAPPGFFRGIGASAGDELTEDDSLRVSKDDDEESRWGDAEDEDDGEPVGVVKRSSKRGLRRRSAVVADDSDSDRPLSKVTPDESATPTQSEKKSVDGPDGAATDEKVQTLMDFFHRTLGIQPPQGIMPHLPKLLDWETLPQMPQMPAVFPIAMPWPSFLSDRREDQPGGQDEKDAGAAVSPAAEWRAFFEKMYAVMLAAATARQAEEAPPVYTPRESRTPKAEGEDVGEGSSHSATRPHGPHDRPFDYAAVSVTEQEMNMYAYRPTHKQSQKKQDRMLILFWIPILLLSLIWAFFLGLQHAFSLLRTALPLRSLVRG